MSIQNIMKATEQYFPVVRFIMLYKLVLLTIQPVFSIVCFSVFYTIKFFLVSS